MANYSYEHPEKNGNSKYLGPYGPWPIPMENAGFYKTTNCNVCGKWAHKSTHATVAEPSGNLTWRHSFLGKSSINDYQWPIFHSYVK